MCIVLNAWKTVKSDMFVKRIRIGPNISSILAIDTNIPSASSEFKKNSCSISDPLGDIISPSFKTVQWDPFKR